MLELLSLLNQRIFVNTEPVCLRYHPAEVCCKLSCSSVDTRVKIVFDLVEVHGCVGVTGVPGGDVEEGFCTVPHLITHHHLENVSALRQVPQVQLLILSWIMFNFRYLSSSC